MDKNFWDRVKDRAYMNYKNRCNSHSFGDSQHDWEGAVLDEILEEKIEKEAYLNSLRYGDNQEVNWNKAKDEVYGRIRFLAYYVHERNYDQKPVDNWKEAEKIYIENF